jgi:hypothetical protein
MQAENVMEGSREKYKSVGTFPSHLIYARKSRKYINTALRVSTMGRIIKELVFCSQ